MKKRLALSVLAGLCLAPLTAPSAMAAPAATKPPSASDRVAPPPVLDDFRITDDGVRTVQAFAVFSGSAPRDVYLLANLDNGDGDTARVGVDGKIRGNVTLVPGALNHLELQVYHSSDDPVIVPFEADDRRDFGAPEVDVVEHADTGRADVTVTGKAGAVARLYDARGNGVATAELSTASHTFDIPLPAAAVTYTATQKKDAYETPGTRFDLRAVDAALPPLAPDVHFEYRDDSRALLIVRAEAKTVIKVRDENGKVLALRLVPAIGAAQVQVPVTSDEVTVTAARGSNESAATHVDLTATPTR